VFPRDIQDQASAVLAAARAGGLRLATAESCTGGLVAAALTDIAGSSDVFEAGYVTYGNAAKARMLGVPEAVLAGFGAVSAETARAMAEGALTASGAEVAVAVTGVAGPGGGSAEKPVGLVWFGLARRGGEAAVCEARYGDLGRSGVRLAAVRTALAMLLEGVAAAERSPHP
jgi:nicotinamide-nucleotide amidase